MHRAFIILVFAILAQAGATAPLRIVSAAPSVTEILYALGLGSRIAGVTTFCHYPPEAQTKPKIGSYLQPSMEQVVALRPDLVIETPSSSGLREKLNALHIPELTVGEGSVAEIEKAMLEIGRATGVPDRGEQAASQLHAKLDSIHQRYAHTPKRTMMFVVGRRPGELSGIVAVGKGPFLNELIDLAGGRNSFGDARESYPSVSLEQILARNPDVIVDMGEMADTVAVSDARKRDVVKLWSRFPNLKAVQNGRVYAVASDIFVVPGPRVTQAAEEIAKLLHSEAKPR